MNKLAPILLVLTLSACIGTDLIDDPIVGERIDVSTQTLALQPGESAGISASYFDQYGIARDVILTWTATMPGIAEVNNAGTVMAKAPGQTVVRPSYEGFQGPEVFVTVVANENAVASVEITTSKTGLNIGETLQAGVAVRNVLGQALTGKVITWSSSASGIATSNSMGEIMGVASGMATITATVEGVQSNAITINVTGTQRTGNFVPLGGYTATGTATLAFEGDDLILTFSDNFRTSFALGTVIYMANSTNSSQVRNNGLEVMQITTNGGKRFNLSQIKPDITLTEYRYVIILCKPATITFGFADLQ